MALFIQHSAHIFDNTSNKRYIPAIYDGEKFRYYHAFVMNNEFVQFYTADTEKFVTVDGNNFMVID